jgi:hypothetical protein
VSRHKTAEKEARERAASNFDAEAVAKSKAAAAQLRERQDTLNEFERLFQNAQQFAAEVDEEVERCTGSHGQKKTWRLRARNAHAEVERIRDNLKFYRLTWLT